MYSAAMSPPRCPVPRPSSRSCDKYLTCHRMCSGVIVSSATNAGPGSFTEGALSPLEAPAPPAPDPSAHPGRLKHTIRHAEMIFAIPCIFPCVFPDIDRSLPQQSGVRLEGFSRESLARIVKEV